MFLLRNMRRRQYGTRRNRQELHRGTVGRIDYLRIRRANGGYPIPEWSVSKGTSFAVIVNQVECGPKGVMQRRGFDGLGLMGAGPQLAAQLILDANTSSRRISS